MQSYLLEVLAANPSRTIRKHIASRCFAVVEAEQAPETRSSSDRTSQLVAVSHWARIDQLVAVGRWARIDQLPADALKVDHAVCRKNAVDPMVGKDTVEPRAGMRESRRMIVAVSN